jgi:hypothetical protein
MDDFFDRYDEEDRKFSEPALTYAPDDVGTFVSDTAYREPEECDYVLIGKPGGWCVRLGRTDWTNDRLMKCDHIMKRLELPLAPGTKFTTKCIED